MIVVRQLILALAALTTLAAQKVPEFTENGVLTVGETQWGTLFMDSSWRPFKQANQFKPDTSSGMDDRGVFQNSKGETLFQFESSIKPLGKDAYAIAGRATSQAGFDANMLAYSGSLPVKLFAGGSVVLDGKIVELPLEFTGETNLAVRQARKVQAPTASGMLTLEGNFTTQIVDTRKFGGPDFQIRLFYQPHNGQIANSSFQANVSFKPYNFTYVPLSRVANRTFADAAAGDGQGGWTDQGPNQDLSAFS
ncbi:MAG: hypothetical protein ACQKBV_09325, partial [Puniceicoccales bacterium]